jgi:membrane-bound hydrogenase subunit mbhJ
VASFKTGLTAWARKRSIWVFHVNAASCNGCDIEILAALTPRYDAERLGVELVPSPRHADVLLVTGTMNPLMRDRLKTVYEQMPEPKLVVAIGACALGGGVMYDCYNAGHGIDTAIPVNLFIPGCPPRPEAIIYGILKLVMCLPGSPDATATALRKFGNEFPHILFVARS